MNAIKTFSFEKSFATVQLFKGPDEAKRLFIQAIDAYAYQRELVIEWDFQENKYKVHAYQHPVARMITHVSKGVGDRLINRIVELCESYPDSLFVSTMPRNTGFVYFHTRLLSGETPSVDLL